MLKLPEGISRQAPSVVEKRQVPLHLNVFSSSACQLISHWPSHSVVCIAFLKREFWSRAGSDFRRTMILSQSPSLPRQSVDNAQYLPLLASCAPSLHRRNNPPKRHLRRPHHGGIHNRGNCKRQRPCANDHDNPPHKAQGSGKRGNAAAEHHVVDERCNQGDRRILQQVDRKRPPTRPLGHLLQPWTSNLDFSKMSRTAMDTSESYQRDRVEIERLAYKT